MSQEIGNFTILVLAVLCLVILFCAQKQAARARMKGTNMNGTTTAVRGRMMIFDTEFIVRWLRDEVRLEFLYTREAITQLTSNIFSLLRGRLNSPPVKTACLEMLASLSGAAHADCQQIISEARERLARGDEMSTTDPKTDSLLKTLESHLQDYATYLAKQDFMACCGTSRNIRFSIVAILKQEDGTEKLKPLLERALDILNHSLQQLSPKAMTDSEGHCVTNISNRLAVFEELYTSLFDCISTTALASVTAALSDTAWDFRTILGTAKATGLPETVIEKCLDGYPDRFRCSQVPDGQGRRLFAPRSKPVSWKERLSLLQVLVSKSVG